VTFGMSAAQNPLALDVLTIAPSSALSSIGMKERQLK